MSNRLKSFLIAALFAVILILLSGCSASWHVTRAQKKDHSLFVRDTVVKVDTVWLEVAKIDTLFKYRYDTVEFTKDSIRVKYFHNYIDSLVYIEVDCPDSQVITKTNTVTETITLKPTLAQYFKIAIISLIILIAVFFISKLVT
jgi:hypothetical protein